MVFSFSVIWSLFRSSGFLFIQSSGRSVYWTSSHRFTILTKLGKIKENVVLKFKIVSNFTEKLYNALFELYILKVKWLKCLWSTYVIKWPLPPLLRKYLLLNFHLKSFEVIWNFLRIRTIYKQDRSRLLSSLL